MQPVIILIAIAALIFAVFMTINQGYGAQQTNIRGRKGYGMRRPVDISPFRGTDKEVTFGVDGNLVWYGAADPNLLQVAGSGALY